MSATVHVMRQIDVGDSVHLEKVARILQTRELSRGTTVLRSPDGSATQGVVLRHEPLDLKLGHARVGPFEAETRVRLFEIYENADAFKTHLETPHFKKYAETTKDMVKSRKRIDNIPITLNVKGK